MTSCATWVCASPQRAEARPSSAPVQRGCARVLRDPGCGSRTLGRCPIRLRQQIDIARDQGRQTAAHRRAAHGAWRFECRGRTALTMRGLGPHKVTQFSGVIAASRPVAALLQRLPLTGGQSRSQVARAACRAASGPVARVSLRCARAPLPRATAHRTGFVQSLQ